MAKKVIENGNTFIDITEKYITEYETSNKISLKDEEEKYKPQIDVVVSKKRVKTFNEIFASFFGTFFPVKGDSIKEIVRKIVLDFSILLIVSSVYSYAVYFIEKFFI